MLSMKNNNEIIVFFSEDSWKMSVPEKDGKLKTNENFMIELE